MTNKLAVSLFAMAFLARGIFFALALPIGDPFDEAFHYGYAAFLSRTGRPPRAAEPSMAGEDLPALALLPRTTSFGGPRIGFADFAKLPAAERERRRREAFASRPEQPFGSPNYESQQPPLFYATAVPLLRSLPRRLDVRLLAMRIWGALCASSAVPIVFLLFRLLASDEIALLLTAAWVAFPGLATFTGRFTNDDLAVPLVAAILLLCVKLARGEASRRTLVGLAAALAAGCWTKLYVLPLLLLPPLSGRGRRERLRGVMASVAALAATAPWLLRQRADTGDWFGLTETKAAHSAGVGLGNLIGALPGLLRPGALMELGRSFVWPGTMTVPSASPRAMAAVGAAFLLLCIGAGGDRFRRRAVLTGLLSLPLFLAAQVAHAATFSAVRQATGNTAFSAGLEGWYLLVLLAPVLTVGMLAPHRSRPGIALAGVAGFVAAGAMLEVVRLARLYAGEPMHPFRSLQISALKGPAWLLALTYALFLVLLGAGVALAMRRLRCVPRLHSPIPASTASATPESASPREKLPGR